MMQAASLLAQVVPSSAAGPAAFAAEGVLPGQEFAALLDVAALLSRNATVAPEQNLSLTGETETANAPGALLDMSAAPAQALVSLASVATFLLEPQLQAPHNTIASAPGDPIHASTALPQPSPALAVDPRLTQFTASAQAVLQENQTIASQAPPTPLEVDPRFSHLAAPTVRTAISGAAAQNGNAHIDTKPSSTERGARAAGSQVPAPHTATAASPDIATAFAPNNEVTPKPVETTDVGTGAPNGQQAPSHPAGAQPPQTGATPPSPITVAHMHAASDVIELQDPAPAFAQHRAIPLDSLAVHIAHKFSEGAKQFEIRLHPADLGHLDISLNVADDGRVQAVLRAERTETLDLLQRDARVLEQQLRSAGLEVGANALSFMLSGGNNQRQSAAWYGLPAAQETAEAGEGETASNYLAVRTNGALDIRV